MSDREYVLVCKHCHRELVEEPSDDPAVRRSSCPCGKCRSLFIDGGTIDLDEILATTDNNNDFVIYP